MSELVLVIQNDLKYIEPKLEKKLLPQHCLALCPSKQRKMTIQSPHIPDIDVKKQGRDRKHSPLCFSTANGGSCQKEEQGVQFQKKRVTSRPVGEEKHLKNKWPQIIWTNSCLIISGRKKTRESMPICVLFLILLKVLLSSTMIWWGPLNFSLGEKFKEHSSLGGKCVHSLGAGSLGTCGRYKNRKQP